MSRRLASRTTRLGPWALAAPTVLSVLVFAVYPLVYLVLLALSESNLGQPFRAWVGMQNITDALGDALVRDSLVHGAVFAVATTVLSVLLGVAIALLLDSSVRDGRVLRTLLLLPLMTPPITVAVAWRLLFEPSGPLNGVLEGIGIASEPVAFLATSPWAMGALIVADVWQWTPLVVLLVFAALRGVPEDVYEAARVDGASGREILTAITLPMVLPAIVAVGLLKLILSFKLFDLVYMLTAGGPGFDTTTSAYDIYRTALESFDIGSAAAKTLIFVVFVSLVVMPVVKLRDWTERRLT